MKTKISFCVLYFLFSLQLYSQQNIPNGWDKIKWGANIKEILKVYKDSAKQTLHKIKYGGGRYSTIKMNNYFIQNTSFSVQFLLDFAKNSLTGVVLSPNEPYDKGFFEAFEELLIEKYGKPSKQFVFQPNQDMMLLKTEWSFPTTSIYLLYAYNSRDSTFNDLKLSYSFVPTNK